MAEITSATPVPRTSGKTSRYIGPKAMVARFPFTAIAAGTGVVIVIAVYRLPSPGKSWPQHYDPTGRW